MHNFDDKTPAPLWNYQGVLVRPDPVVLKMRSSSTRLATLDRVTGAHRAFWHLPGGGSTRSQRPRREALRDYGGTILVIGWQYAFWFAVQRWILAPQASDDLEAVSA
jgi:hypothetical protein